MSREAAFWHPTGSGYKRPGRGTVWAAPAPEVPAGDHGRNRSAQNTGLNYNGVSLASLVATTGTTYSTNGQVIEGRDFTGPVRLTGNGQTLRNCRIRMPGGASTDALVMDGANAVVEGVQILPSSGSFYHGIFVGGADCVVRGVDIAGCENNITIEAARTLLDRSYLHGSSNASNPSGHRDTVEVFGASGLVVQRSRIVHPSGETSAINLAPWVTNSQILGADIVDNYIDGGGYSFTIDNQAAGIRNVRVLRNDIGTAQVYGDRRGPDGNDPVIVRTAAAQASNPNSVLWPDTGADVNRRPNGGVVVL